MKNDSWLFPFPMFGDSFFDGNKDGKLSGFETVFRDAFQREQMQKLNERTNESKSGSSFSGSSSTSYHSYSSSNALNEKDHAWREDCEDGSDHGIDPEDYETEKEYEDALAEAIENDIGIEVTATLSVESPSFEKLEAVKRENFPNERRYNAAYTLANDFIVYGNESFEKKEKDACHFILEKADTILAANYLSHDSGFLYAQAIKDNFKLPCSLPDEDEAREMEFYEIIFKIAKRDISLSLKVWNWCLEQFGPYVQYYDNSANELTSDVFLEADVFPEPEKFYKAVVNYMNGNQDFLYTVISLSSEHCYNISGFISAAVSEKLYDTAKAIFTIELAKVSGNWKWVFELINGIINACSDWEQVEDMEYFRDNMFPAVRKISDGMIRDEIPEFERKMTDYINYVMDHNEKYAYCRKNAWRKTAPDGKEYGLDPKNYKSEQEYLDALKYEKYGWRQWYANNSYGLDVNDYETRDDYFAALTAKRYEEYEAKRKEEDRKLSEWRKEAAKDKNIYNCSGVLLPDSSRVYSYLAGDLQVQVGDTVIVPVGVENEEMEGLVVSVGQYSRLGVPYPIEKTKKIIRKK